MKINILHLYGFSIVYFIISFFLFAISTGGWASLWLIFILAPAYFILFLIFTISIFFKKNKTIYLSKKLFYFFIIFLFLSQIYLVFFNRLDCGDNMDGSYNFIEHLLLGYDCGKGSHRYSDEYFTIFPIAMMYYNTVLYFYFGILFLSLIYVLTRGNADIKQKY